MKKPIERTSDFYKKRMAPGSLTYTFRYLFPIFSGKRVLDLGCGSGTYLEHFSKDSVGVDISEPNIKVCNSKKLNIVKADLNEPLAFENEEFEFVFSSYTIDHVVYSAIYF